HPPGRSALAPGVHGMSNGALDAPWPKTLRLRASVTAWIAAGDDDLAPLWRALADETLADPADLPDTGVGPDLERRLSPAFIRGSEYGTRASTIVAVDAAGHGWIHERRFGPDGVFIGETRLENRDPGAGTGRR
ncbi:NRDE family protein, partial [Xanthomonas sacchari]|uniref:NRDE family protein n=1 Tax=Xanthomonas sacchari TaxID=56458 RepID=UPI00225E12C4